MISLFKNLAFALEMSSGFSFLNLKWTRDKRQDRESIGILKHESIIINVNSIKLMIKKLAVFLMTFF